MASATKPFASSDWIGRVEFDIVTDQHRPTVSREVLHSLLSGHLHAPIVPESLLDLGHAPLDVGLLAGVVTIVVFSFSTLALTAATSAVEGRPKHSVQTPIFVDGKWCAAL